MTPATIKATHSKHPKPAQLDGQVKLTLHTIHAQKLFLGIDANKRSINLLQFGKRMAEIWDAAEKDDPYADWYLLKVYDAILQLRKELSLAIDNYQQRLRESSLAMGLNFTVFFSKKPVIETLWFRTQYGYMGSGLVAQFDELMRIILTANRVGVLLEISEDAIRKQWLEKLLTLFKLPLKWEAKSITRQDVVAKNDLVKEVESKLGMLPEAILSKKLRSPFSPEIKVTPLNNTKDKENKTQSLNAET
ncbi:MAG: TIGR03761 family integrating conjugative element protein [Gammaproteobacteria bacterium]|nr:TIGR03761 family integrating conjugative element protein [Gammaproteobacteria bacterium]MBY0544821.1 TIGR03761 family integrating conjugative element protein [Gammaproteobacteria bacterium]